VSDNLRSAQAGYAAFGRGDMTALADVLALDVRWCFGGDNALSGTYVGQPAVFRMFGELFMRTDGTFLLEPLTVVEPRPDLVLALIRLSAAADGRTYVEDAVQRLAMRDGRVSACTTYLQNGHLLDVLLGPRVITLAEPNDLSRQSHAVG
jgi:ketosteroid isomerase-like protein